MRIRCLQPLLPALLLALATVPARSGATSEEPYWPRLRSSLEASPISPFFDIYAVQYLYKATEKNEAILGLAYTNVEYDFGVNHAPTLILGYRRYLWTELHLEYQLWPAYNFFYEKDEGKYYNGFDLWNEFRFGYEFDFRFRRIPLYLNFQYLIGFGLVEGNKPESFKKEARDNPYFQAPVFFLGWRF